MPAILLLRGDGLKEKRAIKLRVSLRNWSGPGELAAVVRGVLILEGSPLFGQIVCCIDR